MNKNNLLKKYLFGFILCLFSLFVFNSNDASAAMTPDEIYQNALYNAMQQCYSKDIVPNPMRGGMTLDMNQTQTYYENLDSLFSEDIVDNSNGSWLNEDLKIYVPTVLGKNLGNELNGGTTDIHLGVNLMTIFTLGAMPAIEVVEGHHATYVTCHDLFVGHEPDNTIDKGQMDGVVAMSGQAIPRLPYDDSSVIPTFLKNMGYTKEVTTTGTNNEVGSGCIKIEYKAKRDGADFAPVGTICWNKSTIYDDPVVPDGSTIGQEWKLAMSDKGNYTFKLDDAAKGLFGENDGNDGNPWDIGNSSELTEPVGASGGIGASININVFPIDSSEESAMPHTIAAFTCGSSGVCETRADREAIKNIGSGGIDEDEYYYYRLSYFETTEETTAVSELRLEDDRHKSYMEARAFLSGRQDEPKFERQDKYTLYMYYLNNIYYVETVNDNCLSERPASAIQGEGDSLKYYTYTDNNWCRVSIDPANKVFRVSGFKNNNNLYLTEDFGFEDVLNAIWEIDPTGEDWGIPIAPMSTNGENGDGTTPTGDVDPCQNNAGSLAWIVCPVMKGIGNALEWAYKGAVEPLLVVNSQEFFGGTNSPARQAWSIMVGFANSAMIIFLIIIIFSQLTGVGIDNYGIKKSLPKILVAAVLINLSFILCQVLVEVSNICGQALYNLFSSINIADSVMVNGKNVAISKPEELFTALFYLMCGGLVAFGGLTVYDAVSNGGGVVSALVIPVILALLVAIIAILFFFVIVGLRKAGVVMLVIISPIAVLCYMLPNTKKYFDKWLKAFEGLLFVYPICGLLLGGSQFLAKVILRIGAGSNDFLMYFVGSMLLVVPYFFVPSLIKGSFATMGNIGAKISNMGRSIGKRSSGRLDKAARNSQRLKDRVAFNQEKAANRRAERVRKRLSGKDNLSARKSARLAKANATVLDYQKNRAQDKYSAAEGSYTAQQSKQQIEAQAENESLLLYNDANYRLGKANSKQLSKEADRLNNEYLANDDAFNHKKAQQLQSIRNDRIKMHTERFQNMSRGNFGTEFNNVLARNDMEEVEAGIAAMNAGGYNKELGKALLDHDIVTKSANGAYSASDLNAYFSNLAKSEDVTISSYAKDQMKAISNNSEVKNFKDYIQGSGDNSFARTLATKGSGILKGQNDDVFALLSEQNYGALSDDDIIEVAQNPKDDRVLAQLRDIMRKRGGLNMSRPLSAEEFLKIKDTKTLAAMSNYGQNAQQLYGDAISHIRNDNRLMARLDPKVKQWLTSGHLI